MKKINEKSLSSYSDAKRKAAVEKFKIINPHFTDGVSLQNLNNQ